MAALSAGVRGWRASQLRAFTAPLDAQAGGGDALLSAHGEPAWPGESNVAGYVTKSIPHTALTSTAWRQVDFC